MAEKSAKMIMQTSGKERMGYYSYYFGQNIIYFIVTLYFAVYCTDVLGISAAAVAVILLVARFWDAIMDPVISILVEKAHFKGGKFKPWINAVVFILPAVTFLMMAFGSHIMLWSSGAKIAYCAIIYMLWGSVYSCSDAPSFALQRL